MGFEPTHAEQIELHFNAFTSRPACKPRGQALVSCLEPKKKNKVALLQIELFFAQNKKKRIKSSQCLIKTDLTSVSIKCNDEVSALTELMQIVLYTKSLAKISRFSKQPTRALKLSKKQKKIRENFSL